MYLRMVKKKCNVRGCGNTETFAIAKTKSEIGNIFMCASCLAEALSGVDEARAKYKAHNEAKKNSSPPPIFYNPFMARKLETMDEGTVDEDVTKETDLKEDEISEEVLNEEEVPVETAETSDKYTCTECGKNFDTLKGLNMHKKIHAKE